MGRLQTAWRYLTQDDYSIRDAIAKGVERRASKTGTSTMAHPAKWLYDQLHGGTAYAGVQVTEGKALGITAVYACVRVLSETVASLPLILYKRLSEGGKTRAVEHPLFHLLHVQPNKEMSAFQFKELLESHAAIYGNGYAQIVWNNSAEPTALWPLLPDKMDVARVNGEIVYQYDTGPKKVPIPAYQVFHLPGLGYDGVKGYNPVSLQMQMLGNTIATEEFTGRYWSNDSTPGGVLEHPGRMSDDAHLRLKGGWEKAHQDITQKHKVAILEEGVKYHQISIPPNEAQFIETRKYQLQDIARMFRMQPHMIQDLERATFSNIEHQSLEFVRDTIRPWLVRWEQTILTKLLNPWERKEYYAEFLVDALLRGDYETRMRGYRLALETGIYNVNEVREFENRNPRDGGEDYYRPLNWAKEGSEPEPKEQARSIETRSAGERYRMTQSYRGLFRDVFQRIVSREVAEVRHGLHKEMRDTLTFKAWLEEYYSTFGAVVRKQVKPVYRSFAEVIKGSAAQDISAATELTAEDEQFLEEYVDSLTENYSARSQNQLIKLVHEAEEDPQLSPTESVEKRLDAWDETKAGKTASIEATRSAGAITKLVYASAGIRALRWVTAGSKTCPYCQSMSGKVVGIRNNFAWTGTKVNEDMEIYRNVGHPPLHQGCVCQIMAV